MAITIDFGWWLVPALITIISLGLAAYADRDNSPGPYGAGAFISLILYSAAIIVSLVVWLIWALVF